LELPNWLAAFADIIASALPSRLVTLTMSRDAPGSIFPSRFAA
jgi:hypothetical protein